MKILYVCTGNICRSPTGEAILQKKIEEEGLKITVESAATHAYHIGELPDPRSRNHGEKRGYEFKTRARKFNPKKDFEDFDLILIADESHRQELARLDPEEQYSQKIKLCTDYCQKQDHTEVPDPYYGTAKDFELVLDILEDSVNGLLKEIKKDT